MDVRPEDQSLGGLFEGFLGEFGGAMGGRMGDQ
jgi:hypothetical protein